jgi:hypothetical protein
VYAEGVRSDREVANMEVGKWEAPRDLVSEARVDAYNIFFGGRFVGKV